MKRLMFLVVSGIIALASPASADKDVFENNGKSINNNNQNVGEKAEKNAEKQVLKVEKKESKENGYFNQGNGQYFSNSTNDKIAKDVVTTPEPISMALYSFGILSMALYRRKKHIK